MQRHGNNILYAPSDLGNFIACEHLTQLELAAVLGESERPTSSNAFVDLIKCKEKSFGRKGMTSTKSVSVAIATLRLGR